MSVCREAQQKKTKKQKNYCVCYGVPDINVPFIVPHQETVTCAKNCLLNELCKVFIAV